MKKPRASRSDERRRGRDVDRLAKKIKWAIWVIGGILATFFTWLQFQNIPVAPAIENAKPEVLLRLILILYYFCWIGGSTFDTIIQQEVYIHDPKGGRLPITGYLLLLLFNLIAGVLLWASDDDQKFTMILTAFVTINILGWQYIVYRVSPMIDASRRKFRDQEDNFGLERVNVVMRYIKGRWQWHRFICLAIIVVCSNIITFVPEVRAGVSSYVSAIARGPSAAAISRILPELFFLVFVLVSEGWIWTKRVIAKTSLSVIDRLESRYLLAPKRKHTEERP